MFPTNWQPDGPLCSHRNADGARTTARPVGNDVVTPFHICHFPVPLPPDLLTNLRPHWHSNTVLRFPLFPYLPLGSPIPNSNPCATRSRHSYKPHPRLAQKHRLSFPLSPYLPLGSPIPNSNPCATRSRHSYKPHPRLAQKHRLPFPLFPPPPLSPPHPPPPLYCREEREGGVDPAIQAMQLRVIAGAHGGECPCCRGPRR